MFKSVIYRILLLPYVAICSFLFFIYFLLYFNVPGIGMAGILVLIYPFILIVLIFATLFMLVLNWKKALPGIVILFLNGSNMKMIFALNAATHFQQEKKNRSLRIMTWNVRAFLPASEQLYDARKTNIDDFVEQIKNLQPDIICLQEFFTYTRTYRKNLELIEALGYPYHSFVDKKMDGGELRTGIIIFSKYPILRKYTINIPESYADRDEEPIIADIKIDQDTISVMNLHLQSYGFRETEYRDLAIIRSQEDKELRATKNIFRKMKKAIEFRNQQADLLQEKIKLIKHPLLVCGDLNDVPASYAYKTIRGDLKDAFLENGFGLGKTFVSGRSRILGWLPTLRIDYIFHDPRIQSKQFKRLTEHHSDHHGLVADMELPKN